MQMLLQKPTGMPTKCEQEVGGQRFPSLGVKGHSEPWENMQFLLYCHVTRGLISQVPPQILQSVSANLRQQILSVLSSSRRFQSLATQASVKV